MNGNAQSGPASVVLAVNAGSSSVKCALFTCEPQPVPIERGVFVGTGAASVPALVGWLDAHTVPSAIAGIGHRIVHGGPDYIEPRALSPQVREDLMRLVPFAPNHLPHEMALVDALAERSPGVPHVACFDTAFHQHMPEVARRLPIPAAYDRQGIRRYGFHGVSYAFLMEELARVAGIEAARGRVILAHLGNGSSLAAVRDGVGVDTTMGFTPIGGLVMSTRSGDLDPGVVAFISRTGAVSADRLEQILSGESGLLGLSGSTGDMQALLARERDDPAAQLAVRAYVYSIVKAVGAFAATLGGLDTLVFSGGIGEHAAAIRARVGEGLASLGIAIHPAANDSHAGVISPEGSRVTVRVIPTDEELMLARATVRVVANGHRHAGNR